MIMIKDNYATNIIIRNLIIDGSQSDYYSNIRLGTSFYNMATLIGCNKLAIHDVTFQELGAMMPFLSINVTM